MSITLKNGDQVDSQITKDFIRKLNSVRNLLEFYAAKDFFGYITNKNFATHNPSINRIHEVKASISCSCLYEKENTILALLDLEKAGVISGLIHEAIAPPIEGSKYREHYTIKFYISREMVSVIASSVGFDEQKEKVFFNDPTENDIFVRNHIPLRSSRTEPEPVAPVIIRQ